MRFSARPLGGTAAAERAMVAPERDRFTWRDVLAIT